MSTAYLVQLSYTAEFYDGSTEQKTRPVHVFSTEELAQKYIQDQVLLRGDEYTCDEIELD